MMRKNWAYPPTASGSYGRLACQQMKYIWISKFLKFFTGYTIRIFTSFNIGTMLLVLPMHFSRFFSSKAYCKVCIQAHKIW